MTRSGTPPLPEPDLVSQSRPRNANRLVSVAAELEDVFDVAAGKVTHDEVEVVWLKPAAAARHGEAPGAFVARWLVLLADELQTVWRARNNVKWGDWISDGNVAAAMQIAEKLLASANAAAQADARADHGARA